MITIKPTIDLQNYRTCIAPSGLINAVKRYIMSDIGNQVPPEIHDYSERVAGVDYVLESAPNEVGWYLTSQGKLRKGDRIIFTKDNPSDCYEIVAIDYYARSQKTFIALLRKV